jgi:hypothetical protein
MNHKAACGEAATEEAALVQEMQQYFTQAKGHAGGIRFDNSLWSKIENRVGVWFTEVCANGNQNEHMIPRSKRKRSFTE